jgi:hypothetical protein
MADLGGRAIAIHAVTVIKHDLKFYPDGRPSEDEAKPLVCGTKAIGTLCRAVMHHLQYDLRWYVVHDAIRWDHGGDSQGVGWTIKGKASLIIDNQEKVGLCKLKALRRSWSKEILRSGTVCWTPSPPTSRESHRRLRQG